jgi:hypothetical protein
MTAPSPTFVRGLVLPASGAPTLDVIEDALLTAMIDGDLSLLRRLPAMRPGWFMGDDALVYRWLPRVVSAAEVHPPITVVIDAPDRPMPTLDGSADTAAAWTLGCFGAGAAPGGLQRAASTTPSWSESETVVGAHTGMVRIRLSYSLGTRSSAAPVNRVRDVELALLTALAVPLLELREVLGWFHAAGEALRSPAQVRRALRHAREDDRFPFELWCHTRAFEVGDPDGWAVYDTVGMSALGARDLELCARTEQLQPGDALRFLSNLALYTLAEQDPFKSGHTAESPIGRIRAVTRARGFAAPPRRIVRWAPIGGRTRPMGIL